MQPSPPAWVDAWIGLPFALRGRGPGAYDCYGLVRAVLRERHGHDLPSWDEYDDLADVRALRSVVEDARGRFEPVEFPEEGDAILLRSHGDPVHCGLVVAQGWFLHTRRGIGSALERWTSPRWAARVEGFYRWRAA